MNYKLNKLYVANCFHKLHPTNDYNIFNKIAENIIETKSHQVLNLADHPILPLPQNKNADNSGKMVPLDIARHLNEETKR